ncbi:hypothetical protein GGX14DRAFT_2046 [Mycena pura]|uniref:Uncharacterized protein n=1 Tax=Mycena pura TaxID=153505 RepID=A0AAD6YUW5_9AGAR|nr:hypothetical protein GGX14DRAFT_2046 [Mycena pura]
MPETSQAMARRADIPGPDQASSTSLNLAAMSTQATIGAPVSLIQDADGFTILGGQFTSAAGNVTVHNHYPQPERGLTSTSMNIVDETLSESEIYCSQLLRQKRGFPLYDPEPRQTLPQEYQHSGVAIGDVGRITPDGAFDFFFNIYLPADHPINDNDVPENFSPLPRYRSKDLYSKSYFAGDHVSTPSVRRLDPDHFPGGDFLLSCRAPQGAVLALPHGSHLQKLENLENIRKYAAAHAESWFKYIKGPRGRELGSLYLVTGCEKASSWGLASFHTVDNTFQLSFKPTVEARGYRWRGNPARKKHHDPSPMNELNQTTFIHGLSISPGTGIWARMFDTVQICEISESGSRSGSESGSSTSSSQGSSLFSPVLGFLSGGAATDGNNAGSRSHVVLSDMPPISDICHPGQLLNNYILEKHPQAAVVMSHDDDWGEILGDVRLPSVQCTFAST